MNRIILGLFSEPVDEDFTLESEFGTHYGIDVEQTDYLDGVTIYHGTAAGQVETTEQEVYIGSESIDTERVDALQTVATDFYADFDAGFVGVDSSSGDFLWDQIGAATGGSIYRAYIDLDTFARDYAEQDEASCWQLGYNREEDSVGVVFHHDAKTVDAAQGGVTQLGFTYLWDGRFVKGTVTKSGYICVFSSMTVEEFGRWLREEMLPYASVDAPMESEGQTSLDEVAADGGETDDE